MKKTLLKLLLSLCCLYLFAVFTGCESGENSKTPHNHEYAIATLSPTCTERGCTVHICACGDNYVDTYVDALGHEFISYVSNGNATCETSGTETATCNRTSCTETHTRTAEHSALNHEFTNYVSDNNATCKADGTKTATCDHAGCNVTNTVMDTNSKLGHSFTNYNSNNNATCETNGTETATCNRTDCNETHTRTAENSALTHDFLNYVSDNNATYESDGTKTAVCSRVGCNETDTICDEDTKLVDYYVTYSAQSNGIVLKEATLSEVKGELIEYTAPEILGYTFIGWSDGIEDCTRVDNSAQENNVLIANYEIECLDAPVVIINTKDCQAVTSKTTYVECQISIVNTDEDYCLTEVSAGIRGRGNSTWSFEKKPYRIKFDKKQSLFGSTYKQKSWTLLANYVDKSLSRNAIAYELGKQFDGIEFSSIHEFVEVFLNGEYLGVYLLCDQIQTGEGRVDVDEEFVADGDTGYLLEMDGRAQYEGVADVDYFTVSGNDYAIKTPDIEEDEYDPAIYVPFIKAYFENCLDKLNNGTWEEIQALMDVDSFVEIYIVQELFANTDVGFSSFYLYKEKGGKLYCGPLWDFDIGAGNSYEHLPAGTTEFPADLNLYASVQNIWFRYFCNHQEFRDLVKERLQTYSSTIFEVIEMLNPTNENGYYTMYKNAFNRNFERWEILEKFVWNNPEMICTIQTLEGQMIYLRDWLKTRYYFLCLQYA